MIINLDFITFEIATQTEDSTNSIVTKFNNLNA